MSGSGAIRVRGARQHNLKGIHVDIPHHSLTVITGPSGSGKSSLAFDTLFAEGQRRYVETFSPYTRQFLERMDKPQVDSMEGIPPAIAIEQANTARTSRSTVGTMTEVADHLKLLFPRVAQLICPKCGDQIRPRNGSEIGEELLSGNWSGSEVLVLFEVPFPDGTPLSEAGSFLAHQGFRRILWEGRATRVEELPINALVPNRLTVIQDRIKIDPASRTRLVEALDIGLRFGKGIVSVLPADHPASDMCNLKSFTSRWLCARDNIEFRAPSPALFSFNNPVGACPDCRGFGRTIDIDYDLAMPDRTLSIAQGVVKPWQSGVSKESQSDLLKACKKQGIPTSIPFNKLSIGHQQFVIEGEPRSGEGIEDLWQRGGWYGVKGFFDWLETKTYKMHVRVFLSRYRAYRPCKACKGGRFQPDVLFYKLGKERASIADLNALPIRDALQLLRSLDMPNGDEATTLLKREIVARLGYLEEVGLGYLTLGRATRTLSGGELQRVNLTSCLGTSLVNTLFVLDEPSIGLHPRDTDRLTGVMRRLRDIGNTVVVVEHDEQVIQAADHLIDLGPGRGAEGGSLVFSGAPSRLMQKGGPASSLTGQFLRGQLDIATPSKRRAWKREHCIQVRGASENNLRQLDLDVPLDAFVCFTGVSGSGKSTLVHDVIYKNLLRAKGRAVEEPGAVNAVLGGERVEDIVLVDQSALTKTPRSNPLLYIGVYDAVRELLAMTEEASSQGLNASAFSFNSGEGRCGRCQGMGYERVEMQFLTDLFVKCPVCDGRRFQPQVLKVRYGGKSVAELLQTTVTEGLAFFQERRDQAESSRERSNTAAIVAGLQMLEEVGLGYLTLGQPLNQLSGGESQRVKLVSYLASAADTKQGRKNAKTHSGKKLLILDEPTTGLHLDDVRVLVKTLHRLVDEGHSLFVIEHHPDVMKNADWIIDLGPEAGDEGGSLVCEGTPEAIARCLNSHTGRFLSEALIPRSAARSALSLREQPLKPVASKQENCIQVRGARHHNLKNLSVDIPLGGTTVVTGLSGSGKSTLAFDLIFAEGQRRYLDSLNVYARQFVGQMEKPDVDLIRGIPPTVAIEQQTTRGGGKSTVGTVTEVHQFVRLLFSKIGQLHDPESGERAVRQTGAQIQAQLEKRLKLPGARAGLQLLAPLIKARKGFHTEVARWAERKGYTLLRVDGKWVEPSTFKALDRYREHSIDVVCGSLMRTAKPAERAKLVAETLKHGRGTLHVVEGAGRETVFSTSLFCPKSGRSFDELDPRLFSFNSPHGWCPECEGYGTVFRKANGGYRTEEGRTAVEEEIEREKWREWAEEGEMMPCPTCEGERLQALARAVTLAGKTIGQLSRLSVMEARKWFGKIKLVGRDEVIARDVLPEIVQRLEFLERVGLGYLQLGRGAKTLSGGESQRVRLAAQLGSNLEGVLYVLDEPTIGLHPRDNERLLGLLDGLKAKGNSLLIVEHDEDTMRRADHIIDLGPGAGINGGRVVAEGSWKQIAKNTDSVTGVLLGKPMNHPLRGERRPVGKNSKTRWLTVEGCRANNLKEVTLRVPLNRLTVFTGVSGSGKSTLMREVLMPAVMEKIQKKKGAKSAARKVWDSVRGTEEFVAVMEVDQLPIGKTSRSTPATFMGIFDEIRKLFSMMPEARVRGYTPGRFSYNSAGGRCEACQGQGENKVEMAFLPTFRIPCETCGGLRYDPETLEIRFKEKSIADVLQMSAEEATLSFSAHPGIHRALSLLCETGLGYLTLGQSSPTLSGGEAQRMKLVTELSRKAQGQCLYLLEEPTVGLHLADVRRLIDLLHRLVDEGHTVVVIEHHLDVIAEADHLIDLGPEGGEAGGRIVMQGTPEQIAACSKSHTGAFLKKVLRIPSREST